MLVLGIETSDRPGSAALCCDGECLAEVPLELDGLRHAQALPPVVASLLSDHQVVPGSLDLIAVSHGPGSFTGLRVGIAFAKTLAWAVGCKLVAVDTFEAIASETLIDVDTLWVASDAHRDELFVRHFSRKVDGRWQPDGDHSIVACHDWCDARTIEEVVVTATPGLLDRGSEPVRHRIVSDRPRPGAESVARLGYDACLAGAADDPITVEPLYLRRSAAEEKRDSLRPDG